MQTIICEDINKYFAELTKNLGQAQKETKKIITKAAYNAYDNIKSNTPCDKNDLKSSIYIMPLKGANTERSKAYGNDFFGYAIGFNGKTKNGLLFDDLANQLDYGHGCYCNKAGKTIGAITGTNFISKEISKLKSIDIDIKIKIDEIINRTE